MIHQYKMNGYNIVIDVFSGSVHLVDALAYDAIRLLDLGKSEEEAREEIKRTTRRFFRKQLSWYRRDPRITWLPAGDPGNPGRILENSGT